ncbi:MAG: glycoside hydrolase family 53 protein [Bacteroidota bacterium]
MQKSLLLFLLGLLMLAVMACEKNATSEKEKAFYKAADISSLPEIESDGVRFYDLNGKEKSFTEILKNHGVNTIRLKLWVHPENPVNGLHEVAAFAGRLKDQGFKTWLTVHYSDTWADPGDQQTPEAWQDLDFEALKDSVYEYSRQVVNRIQPEILQIGNEINNGFLHPQGNIHDYPNQFITLVQEGIRASRQQQPDTKIMIHYAGLQGSSHFFAEVSGLDYDLIGISYYPIWHGKNLDSLQITLNQLSKAYQKDILVAETAYPFTLDWNDWTTNIVGLEEQLILPDYPASPEGQKAFLQKIRSIVETTPRGTGFCYWGAERIAYKGIEATDGSGWENQALFSFSNHALPALEVFD